MFFAKKITIVPGTPQRIVGIPTLANRLVITPLAAAGAGAVLVVAQDVAVTPMVTNDNTTVTQIAGATSATVPGLPFRLERLPGGPAINVQEYGIDGAHADPVQVSWEI